MLSSLPRISLLRFWVDNQKSVMLNTPTGACTQFETATWLTTTSQASPTGEEVRVDMPGMKVESKPVELVTALDRAWPSAYTIQPTSVGGLAHIMLPDSSVFLQELLPFKFADTAVPALAKAIRRTTGLPETYRAS